MLARIPMIMPSLGTYGLCKCIQSDSTCIQTDSVDSYARRTGHSLGSLASQKHHTMAKPTCLSIIICTMSVTLVAPQRRSQALNEAPV